MPTTLTIITENTVGGKGDALYAEHGFSLRRRRDHSWQGHGAWPPQPRRRPLQRQSGRHDLLRAASAV